MSVNLIRNSKVYFTTNLDSNKQVKPFGSAGELAAFTAENTWRIEVMNGFSFSQNTTTETVTLNEAGAAPVRGQRTFNTALDPVEFSFSTYLRPAYLSSKITAAEKVLWNAFMGTGNLGSGAWTETTDPKTQCTFAGSNVHQLQAFGLIIILDNVTYVIDNCALDTATVDFGIDAIAMAAWTGRGTRLRSIETVPKLVAPTNFADIPATGKFLANKLSTVTVKGAIVYDFSNDGDTGDTGEGGTADTYIVPITGGSLTLSNNLTYLTPEVMGVVNQPVTYFTGTRAISGELTAYLRSSSTQKLTSELQADILATSATAQETKFAINIEVGGVTSAHRVEFQIPAAMLSVPTVTTDQVVTTTIGFTAQGSSLNTSDEAVYDIDSTNELIVKYFAAA